MSVLQRLASGRWLRITAWTATAVVWGTTAVAASAAARPQPATTSDAGTTPTIEPAPTTTGAQLPAPPENGLVVIRYTPVPPPPPQVITRTVTAAARVDQTVVTSGS